MIFTRVTRLLYFICKVLLFVLYHGYGLYLILFPFSCTLQGKPILSDLNEFNKLQSNFCTLESLCASTINL